MERKREREREREKERERERERERKKERESLLYYFKTTFVLGEKNQKDFHEHISKIDNYFKFPRHLRTLDKPHGSIYISRFF